MHLLFLFLNYALVFLADFLPDERIKRIRTEKKPKDFRYNKSAHMEGPMLISAGDDTKLCAYPVKNFTSTYFRDICPVPQRTPIQLVLNTAFNQSSMLLVQSSHCLDIHLLQLRNVHTAGGHANPEMQRFKIYASIRVPSRASQQIICSTISNSGVFVAYSNQLKTSLLELKCEVGKITLSTKKLPQRLPFIHSMIFTHDSTWLILAGHDRKIYVSWPYASPSFLD